ncbi:unnamed protein product, partial [Ixodes pacificus]
MRHNYSYPTLAGPYGENPGPFQTHAVAPAAPDTPRVDKVTKNSVTLSWNKPTSDGGSKVKGYIVQKKPKDAKDWTPVNILPHPDTTFTVPGLDEGQEYEFRVVAVNDVGESPPSKPTGLVLVEEQPGEWRLESPLIRDATADADAAP